MATYPFDFSVPNPLQAATGSQKTGLLMPTIASAINAAHAINVGCLVSQSFAGAESNIARGSHFHQYDPATSTAYPTGAAYVWAVPVLSAAHTAHTAIIDFVRTQAVNGSSANTTNVGGEIEIRCQVPASNSTTFDISQSSLLATVAVNATNATNTAVVKTVDITIPFSSTANFILLALCVDWPTYDSSSGSNDETAFILNNFQVYAKPLTSPLASGIIDCFSGEFEPVGQAATKSGAPFAAALGLSLLQSLDAIDKRRTPLVSYSRCLIESRLTAPYATTNGRDALQSPRGYPVLSTSLVRNCPQLARVRLVARISPPRGATAATTYSATFAAAPHSSDDFPSANDDPTSRAQQTFTVLGSASFTECVTTFQISTPSRLGPLQNRHIRLGLVEPDDVLTAANVDFFSFWLEPI